ncbi:MAG: serine--tRNA ligase [Hyphomicrobiales bacterium]|nr:serine--tRNA ligase [Hyphomicrobiales bacterium]
MLDIKWIRDNPEALDRALKDRGAAPAAGSLITLDEERRTHIKALEESQARRNTASKAIGKAKASGDEETAQRLMAEVADLKAFLQEAESKGRILDRALEDALAVIPNLPLDDVPVGPDEAANAEYRRWGTKPTMNDAKEHFELGEVLGQMDFETAARLSGSRFVVLRCGLARLERALGQFMLDLHTTEHGYEETQAPLLVRDDAPFGTGNLPKAAEDMFATEHETAESRLWLIPTAEVPLTNLVRESILSEDELPRRYAALTPCFRSEAGAAGKDTRGMLRQHQFNKVELVSITTPEQSLDEQERLLVCAETVMQRLNLHYRTMTLSTGDMGFAARKTYDIEVWLPGQAQYREISSCSICGDFQARRMKARYRPKEGKGTRLVHTLNGSGVAVGRALIAVMENYQNPDGSITVPEALRPYMGAIERIG